MKTLQVGVKVVLKNKEGNILILARSLKYETAKGSWDIPGGRITADTALLENLEREVQEETGLSILGTPKLLAAQDIFFTRNDGEEMHIVRLTYTAHTEGEPVLDGTEHTEERWVSLEELGKVENLDRYLKDLIDTGVLTDSSWG